MFKLLILFFLGWLVWRALRPAAVPRPVHRAAQTSTGERMQACAHCGLNVPESEILSADGFAYCCDAHLKLGPSARTGAGSR
ncbi:MAG TPA: PP0621 family protein [Rhodocyclaceae bacterium]|jgi:uncharacterized protein|nr:PP0621 family protein [Rhodocyclaceae bacterium]